MSSVVNKVFPMSNTALSSLEQHDEFIARHIGPDASDIATMIAAIGTTLTATQAKSLDEQKAALAKSHPGH